MSGGIIVSMIMTIEGRGDMEGVGVMSVWACEGVGMLLGKSVFMSLFVRCDCLFG